eukprot:11162755-Alexandrium_andersonii.AAC.1
MLFLQRQLDALFEKLASLRCSAPRVQSAIRPRPVHPAIRLNPQSAIRYVLSAKSLQAFGA